MLLIRNATPVEMDRLAEFTVHDPVGFVNADRFREEAAAGRFRPEWTWFAEDRSRIVGRAVWWGRADSRRPLALDCLHVLPDVLDRVALATEILSRGHAAFNAKPEYTLALRTTGRDGDHATADAVAWRRAAAKAAGLTSLIERLRYEWTPDAGVPAASTRLVFRPATDDEFVSVFRRVAVGSLDLATQRALANTDADRQARDDLEFYSSCPGERSWWRLAQTIDGQWVGFAIPSATPYHRNVGYLGVVPEMRGRGYVDDLLGEITRTHAAGGADRITATTDVSNTPMAAAFDRANYRLTEVRMVFAAPFLNHYSTAMDDIASLRRILKSSRNIAMVGLSDQWYRPSHFVAKYLQQHGYRIFPVNPRLAGTTLLGEPVVASVLDLKQPVDMVDVFRRSADVLPIAEQAIQIGARVLWQQIGVVNRQAEALVRAAGLDSVMDRCVKIEHGRIFGGLNWVGVNTGVISAKRPV